MSDAVSLPIAGWYPDPENSAAERWWTGISWSDHRRAATVASPPQPSTAPAPQVATALPSPYSTASASAPPTYVPQTTAPGNLPGTLGFIFAVGGIIVNPLGLLSLAGGIVSIFGLRRAKVLKDAGVSPDYHGYALSGVIVGFVWFALNVIAGIIGIVWLVYYASHQGDFTDFSSTPTLGA